MLYPIPLRDGVYCDMFITFRLEIPVNTVLGLVTPPIIAHLLLAFIQIDNKTPLHDTPLRDVTEWNINTYTEHNSVLLTLSRTCGRCGKRRTNDGTF